MPCRTIPHTATIPSRLCNVILRYYGFGRNLYGVDNKEGWWLGNSGSQAELRAFCMGDVREGLAVPQLYCDHSITVPQCYFINILELEAPYSTSSVSETTNSGGTAGGGGGGGVN